MTDSLKYRAFISYCRPDRVVARRLQLQLERYVLPRALRFLRPGTTLMRQPLKPVFRDEDELVPGNDLSERLRRALVQSEFLIVVCSPNATKSEWISREITSFIQLGRADRILAVVVDGEPNAIRHGLPSEAECLPAALRFTTGADGKLTDKETQPLWVDWRGRPADQYRSLLRITAALLGLASFDDLIRRDAQARARRLASLIVAAIVATTLLATAGYIAWSMTFASVAYQTTRFRAFYDAELKQELTKLDAKARPEYRIVVTDDLNTDGVTDFIVINKTLGFCGSGGCSHEIYIGDRSSGFTQLDAMGLFGKDSVWAYNTKGAWKDIFTSDSATASGTHGVYNRNSYDASSNSYTEVESWFCGVYFEYCGSPVAFCPLDRDEDAEAANEISVREGPLSPAPNTPGNPEAKQIEVPDEFNWIRGVTPDGKWFMIHYKFSGIFYAKREQMDGKLPTPRKTCTDP